MRQDESLRTGDRRAIFLAQALRALAYGFGAVLLGASLEDEGWSSGRVGLLLTSIVAGTGVMSLLVGRAADRIGRRRTYALLFAALGASGAAFALSDALWILLPVALAGVMSTEVMESGPFTSLEQSMLPATVRAAGRARAFGTYNAIAAVAGSVGALLAGGPGILRATLDLPSPGRALLLAFVPVALLGVAVALRLSDRVEVGATAARARRRGPPLDTSRPAVLRLAGLFALDSFAGGFVVQTYVAFWFRDVHGVPLGELGLMFFAVGVLQAGSLLLAPLIAERVGLLNTMVFSHLPSNLLLASIPLAPSLPVAIGLLLGRQLLSQMDVPTRQAYLAALVTPAERTAAAGYTNSARSLARPLAPALAGLAQQVSNGLPFFLAGGLKSVYDLTLLFWFRRVPLRDDDE